ncbi:class I SAM-dependent methyltransferase [Sorangium sp. So ce834]|uniref:SAM-dependent methyltransferase n=1 Tax=Sorangium sp. So ce834 TaxID=3133321 RepID=UPI003F5DA257
MDIHRNRASWRAALSGVFTSVHTIAKGRDPRWYYNNLGENVFTEQSKFLNLGYWADPETRTMDAASTALVDLVAEAAKLSGSDEVLDVGFGFGDQDIHWTTRYSPKRIVGINVTEKQVEEARRRIAELGLDDRIDLRVGSATDMRFAPETFDKVLAVESAFHFDTRDKFFGEAFRVLRPGGRITTADIIPLPGRGSSPLFTLRSQAPAENHYPRDVYAERLRAAGFVNVEVRSIRKHVYDQYLDHLDRRSASPDFKHKSPLLRLLLMKENPLLSWLFASFDYVIASGEKPGNMPHSAR